MKRPIRILSIPAETFPTHQPFLGEIYSKENTLFKTVFLMKTEGNYPSVTRWNESRVYLIRKNPRSKFLKGINTYFSIDFRYLFWIPRIVYKERIDIIQVRDLTFPVLVALILKIAGKKVVYQKSHPHEYYRTDISRIKSSNTRFPHLYLICRKVENILLHKMMHLCHAVFPITHYMASELNKLYGISYDKMFPFGMGFNFEVTNRVHVNKSPSSMKFVYIGRLDRDRGFEVLLTGFSLYYFKKAKGTGIYLDFVGGPEREAHRLKQLAQALGIGRYVRFHGEMERSDVYKILPQYNLGVSWVGKHRRFLDASPTKLMEYLAHGLPFLATDTVLMHRDIVQATGAGVLTTLDPNDVCDKIAECVEKYPILAEKAKMGPKYIMENHNYARMRDKLFNIYSRLVQEC